MKAYRRKSRHCRGTRKKGGFRRAAACVARGKGRTASKRKAFNAAIRVLRRSKKGRALIRRKKLRMAKTHAGKRVPKRRRRRARKSRRRSRRARKSRRRRRR